MSRAVVTEVYAYKVNGLGLGNRYHKVLGCAEEPKMTAACPSV